ncbi:hypothetical protein G9X67_00320 [Rhizobium sp. WYCCWR 11152]|uniref:hypothetical protein n=1 Tax=Rhizobium sp. WYCCWR 11152 TaxID=2692316 RepID=UPI001491D507|nr:hypothetical protein [Rhizobium sp. WYCCWR 11152]NNU63747.1 hypothetical protein [Rhizobium sp. WYCCWR 11152]
MESNIFVRSGLSKPSLLLPTVKEIVPHGLAKADDLPKLRCASRKRDRSKSQRSVVADDLLSRVSRDQSRSGFTDFILTFPSLSKLSPSSFSGLTRLRSLEVADGSAYSKRAKK